MYNMSSSEIGYRYLTRISKNILNIIYLFLNNVPKNLKDKIFLEFEIKNRLKTLYNIDVGYYVY